MDRIKELKEARAAVILEAKAITGKAEKENRNLTSEEVDDIKAKMAEADTREDEIRTLEELELRAVNEKMDKIKDKTPEGAGGFETLGEFMRAVRFHPNDSRLVKEQSMGESDEGGYLVPTVHMTTLLQVSPQEAIVRPRATVIPADQARPDATIDMPAVDYSENMYGGVEVDWIEEGEEKPETDAKLRLITLIPHEQAATITVTDKLLRNSAAAEMLLTKLLRGALVASEDTSFVRGTGTGQPDGVIGHPCVVQVPRDTASDVTYVDLVEMYASVRGNAVWVASPTILPRLMQMEDGGGHLIWQPNAAVGPTGTLLGLPLIKNERQPVLGTEGDLMLADFSAYLIKDGYGIAVAASEHVLFKQNKTVIKAFKLVDGAPWPAAPFTLEDGETEVSPFVVLSDVVSS